MSNQANYPSSMQSSLTSNPECFSDEAWELLLAGEDAARQWRHIQLDVEHLLQVLFTDRAYSRLIEALPIDKDKLLDLLEGFLSEQKLSRGSELFIGNDLEDLLEEADRFRNHWGSKLIEVSHLLVAFAKDPRIGGELFDKLGLPSERLEAELKKLPLSSRPSQTISTR